MGKSSSSKPSWSLPTLAEVRAEKARRRLAEFIRQGWHVLEPSTPLEWNWHIDAIADHVQAALVDWRRAHAAPGFRARIQNLLINVPPGTAKSRIVSVFAPAWMWIDSPGWKAIFLSANPRVALRDSVYCRELMRSAWYREGFRIQWSFSDDQDAKGLFRNTAGGFRQAIGFTAKITGDRGDAIIWDDPNDPEEVHREVSRATVNERWDDVVQNRVNDLRTSVRIGIQQRVHVDDLSGHILATGSGWEHLSVAMEKEAKPSCECPTCSAGRTALGWVDLRQTGELLDPRRFPPRVLEQFRRKSYLWTSQYQQRPVPAAGNLFKPTWWRFWRHAWEDEVPELASRTVVIPDEFDRELLSWDMAFKKTDGSDLVAGGAWCVSGARRFLVDLVWRKMSFVETRDAFAEQVERRPAAAEKLIEDKANGPAVISSLETQIPGLIGVDPQGGKEARAAATSYLVEAGNVFLPLHAEWRDRYIAEHTAFPQGAHDDAVDQQSQLLLRLIGSSEIEFTQLDRSNIPGRRI